VFEVSYFGSKAYLAQSPQFYKQMCIGADFDRVFEVAPVYRAENSNTPRHMTEFIGLDLEMAFNEHYHEVLDVIDSLFQHIFEGLFREHAHDLQLVSQQYPCEPLKYKFPSPLLKFSDAVAMLTAAGFKQELYEDLSTENEKELGKLVRAKYDTDYYRLDKFPTSARPFYTMLDADDPQLTNSYDFFMRGQEVLSGAQRIHDRALLIERAKIKGVDIDTIEGYTSSFKHGMPPHAGCGLGLNRVTFLFLGLTHITQSTLFPRLTNRLYP
jgi:aspartyl/asparaginyl-tRNA synthetase